jgi:hypothetical protein
MIDRTTPLQVPGRIADRQAEARARRLAAEAKGAAAEGEGNFWLSDGIATLRVSGGAVLRRVRRKQIRVTAANATAPSSAPARSRA